MHQRSCRVIKGLDQQTFESVDLNQTYDDTGQIDHQIDFKSIPNIKPGAKLPKSDNDWKLANNFFASSMPISNIEGPDVVSSMNSIIYHYFFVNYGSLDNSDPSNFVAKFADYSTTMIKSTQKKLKNLMSDLLEIKYLARTLRLKLHKIAISYDASIGLDQYDQYIDQKSFWGCVKQHFKQANSLTPLLDSYTCTQFFCSSFRSINRLKSYKNSKLDSPSG